MLALVSILLFALCAFVVSMHFIEKQTTKKTQQEIGRRIGVESRKPDETTGEVRSVGSFMAVDASGSACLSDKKGLLETLVFEIAKHLPKRKTSRCIDRDLPELIDVLALGMEAGLSFESAFAIYANRFDTALACECRPTSALMTSGIMSRDDAMQDLASRLDSNMFWRFVRITLRSVKFGSRLLPTLEGLSDEARKQYRSSIEEQASKAPTKMLVPTGVLILPAMLLIVCGPFLLELLQQF